MSGQSCQSRGYDGGILACDMDGVDPDCTFDESGCCNSVAGTWDLGCNQWEPDPQGGACGGCWNCRYQERLTDACCVGYSCGGWCDLAARPTRCTLSCEEATGYCCGDGDCELV